MHYGIFFSQDQNLVRKRYRNAVVRVNNTVNFSAQDFGLVTVSQALLCVVKHLLEGLNESCFKIDRGS